MDETQGVLEYKCPCCNAGLKFREGSNLLKCEYCDNVFEMDAVRAYNDSTPRTDTEEVSWEENTQTQWSSDEQNVIRNFQCPSCGGQIMTEESTAATFCPYCDNPTILPSRLSGSIRPDAILPFKTTKEDAQTAFLNLCKGKPLLPKNFTQEQRLDRITGVYVPFWLYDCEGQFEGSYRATNVSRWSDSRYRYCKTDHYVAQRTASAQFRGIPMDGSTKADDTLMESIEPYHYSELVPFELPYLTGFLADKYDVPSEQGESRIRQRVDESMQEQIRISLSRYTTCQATTRDLRVKNSRARYVLLPVWMLNTNFRGKIYTFAMNGQTGKITGELPVCPRRTASWFSAITAGVTVLSMILRLIF